MNRFFSSAGLLTAALTLALPASGHECGFTTWDLIAGQTIKVGTVTVSNDTVNLYVKYELTTPNTSFGTLHLWAGSDLNNLPRNGPGNPIPGQFPFSHDATGLTSYTFTIPFASISTADIRDLCGTTLYVVAHAEVDVNGKGETAFGGPTPGPTGNRWWFYGAYTICCDFGPPLPPFKETAFAKGGWVWTTGRQSNPESLPSLRLTQNRWGWAINLTAPGVRTYDIWAGAGLNNTANGTKVGTLTVNWDGVTALVTYNLFATYNLQEVHLYAGDARPWTLAPGQFGYLDYFPSAGVSTYTFAVPLEDTNGVDGVWLIAHAVVFRP